MKIFLKNYIVNVPSEWPYKWEVMDGCGILLAKFEIEPELVDGIQEISESLTIMLTNGKAIRVNNKGKVRIRQH